MTRLRASQLRPQVLEQAQRTLETLHRSNAGQLQELLDDPTSALIGLAGVDVIVDDRTDASGCSVAGTYRPDTAPPTISISRSASRRRQIFTALHEYGHHLQRTDLDLGGALLDSPFSDELEEAACDVFASRILLPDDIVDEHIGDRGPTAESVAQLYEHSHASRAACCVRAVERLSGPGTVLLLRSDGVVDFAVGRSMVPAARGSDQSATPLIASALRAHDRTVERDATHLQYSHGGTSEQLYGQATWCDGYIVAVVAATNAGWKPFAPPRPGTARQSPRTPAPWGYAACDTCLDNFAVADAMGTCDVCGQLRCDRGHCRCTQQREVLCDTCFQFRHRSQYDAGATTCKTCLG